MIPSGILLIDKPRGISSFDVIRRLKKCFYQAGLKKSQIPKMGHGGTLDPFATGLLVILLGEASKLSHLFLGAEKTYEGDIVFGASTPSGDCDTEIQAEAKVPSSVEVIKETALSFLKTPYFQKPPMYSAKKVGGKKLYELARKDMVIERESIEREIVDFQIHNYLNGCSKFKVTCSSGTYVRVLAEDLALKLGSLAHLKSLRRLSSGDKLIINAMPLDSFCEFFQTQYSLDSCDAFMSLLEVIPEQHQIEVPKELIQDISKGKNDPLIWIQSKRQANDQDDYLFLKSNSSVLAWIESKSKRWCYKRVFVK